MTTCPDPGSLRALIDGIDSAVTDEQRLALEAHLAVCSACRERYDEIVRAAAFAVGRLASLGPLPDAAVTNLAWRRLQARIEHPASLSPRERILSMFAWLGSRSARIGLATALSGLVVVTMLAVTPVGTAAVQALSVFRVTTFKALTVEVDPATMPKLTDAQRKDAEARRQAADPAKFRQELERELAAVGIALTSNATDGAVREVTDLAAARSAANGSPVRTITALPAPLAKGAPRVFVADAAKTAVTADLAKVREAMRRNTSEAPKGAPAIDPNNLPGIDPKATQVSATVQTSYMVGQAWGEGEQQLVFLHGKSPVLTLSEGIDVQELCLALRASPVLSKTNRAQLDTICADKNGLETTLFIPVPQGAIVKDVRVGGFLGIGGDPALLILDPQGKGGAVFAQRDGILYVVAGGYGEQVLVQALNSIK